VLFELGRTVATPAALELLARNDRTPDEYLDRHHDGDWGTVCREDDFANFRAVKYGDRIVSAYQATGGERIFIITEADRSATTILLPEEY